MKAIKKFMMAFIEVMQEIREAQAKRYIRHD
jgi:hypothetical protein